LDLATRDKRDGIRIRDDILQGGNGRNFPAVFHFEEVALGTLGDVFRAAVQRVRDPCGIPAQRSAEEALETSVLSSATAIYGVTGISPPPYKNCSGAPLI
jgi:hypothetical protein